LILLRLPHSLNMKNSCWKNIYFMEILHPKYGKQLLKHYVTLCCLSFDLRIRRLPLWYLQTVLLTK
jgi:hypothetical protein